MIHATTYLAAEEKINPIIPIWQEIVLGAVAFAVVAWVLIKFVFPRMEETFRARVEEISFARGLRPMRAPGKSMISGSQKRLYRKGSIASSVSGPPS